MQTNQESSLSKLNRLDPDVDLYTIAWCADTDLSHLPQTQLSEDSSSTATDGAAGIENTSQANPEHPADAKQLPHKFPKPTTLPGLWDLSDF